MPSHSQEMPPTRFHDSDCSLTDLAGKTIVFIGYGDQGRAHALNLRDSLAAEPLSSSPTILIANRDDEHAQTARDDGWAVQNDWTVAARAADILFLLGPVETQPSLYNMHLAPHLKPTSTLVVASGSNIFHARLTYTSTQDILMISPRTTGTTIRSRFVSGESFSCLVSVEQDGSGAAWKTALALCKGIGAAKGGVVESSAREEAQGTALQDESFL